MIRVLIGSSNDASVGTVDDMRFAALDRSVAVPPPKREARREVRHPIVRYGIALCMTALAAVLRGVLGTQFQDLAPFATFFPAVLAATVVAGPGPGLLATGLSAYLAWSFWLRPASEQTPAAAVTVNLALFVLACLVLVVTAEAARRYHDRSLAGERRFRAAGDLAFDGFGIMEAVRDPGGAISDFRWTYANPALGSTLHRTSDALVGRKLLEELPGHLTHPALFPSYVQVVATGQPYEAEVFYDADGVRGWFRINAVKLNDGLALSLRDVTGRKQREAALQESEERFRLLADAIDDVFWILDLHQQKVVYVSPAYERVWGLPRDALEQNPKAWRQNVHPDDRGLADPVFQEMLEGHRQTFELVYRMRGTDGSWRWVRDKAWLVRAGQIEWVVGMMTDITAAKASEEQQRLVALELDHRLKNAFALVQSMVRLSARGAHDVDQLAKSLEGRIHALARSQDVVVKGARRVSLLEDIIRDTLAPYTGREDRIQVEGPPIEVGARDVPLLHMGFHELATNAAKYGALSVPSGRVSVAWEKIAAEPRQTLLLTWSESGGPVVRPLVQRGFGSTLVEQALASEFAGEIKIAFPPQGVVCTMRLPLSDRMTLGRDSV
jgi:PAS domain S-box-containing protein